MAENLRPECDINKTQIITELLAIPQNERDADWQNNFLTNIQTASFTSSEQQIRTGPDGFPYFVLNTPEPLKPFSSFCISNLAADYLLPNGFGVVINPVENDMDWVFSYGDILNLIMNGEFFTEPDHKGLQQMETTQGQEEVLIGQPSEEYLPLQTRDIMKSFMIYIGIPQPKVMLLVQKKGDNMVRQLVFNIFIDDYPSDEDLNYRLQQMSWFLPRHYIVVSIPKLSNLSDGFVDL